MAEEISRLRSEISEMRRISPVGEILNHQSGGETGLRMDSSGPIAQEESLVTAPVDLRSQQIVEASPTINSVDIRNAPSTAMMDRRVLTSKYCNTAPTSTEIAKKTSVSNKDKTFDNSKEWDAIPTDKKAPMAASMAPQTGDRICFRFQTNECVRPKCPFIHRRMTEQERKDQNYIAKVPEKKTFPTKPMKGAPTAMKFKGKPDFEGNQWDA